MDKKQSRFRSNRIYLHHRPVKRRHSHHCHFGVLLFLPGWPQVSKNAGVAFGALRRVEEVMVIQVCLNYSMFNERRARCQYKTAMWQ